MVYLIFLCIVANNNSLIPETMGANADCIVGAGKLSKLQLLALYILASVKLQNTTCRQVWV